MEKQQSQVQTIQRTVTSRNVTQDNGNKPGVPNLSTISYHLGHPVLSMRTTSGTTNLIES